MRCSSTMSPSVFIGCLLPCLSFPFVLSSLYYEGFTELALYRVLCSVLYIMWGSELPSLTLGPVAEEDGGLFVK